MLEDFIFYKNSGQDFVKIKTLEGGVQTIDVGAVVGFCNCDTHRGYVTVNLMKRHDCLGKECPFFHRFEDFPYWEHYKNVARQKEIEKRQKQQKAFIKKKEEKRLERIKNMAQTYAGRLYFPILITSVTKIKPNRYIINYVSEDRYNDWSEYFSLALMLREHFNGGTYILNHIKKPDGYYATINDFNCRRK